MPITNKQRISEILTVWKISFQVLNWFKNWLLNQLCKITIKYNSDHWHSHVFA